VNKTMNKEQTPEVGSGDLHPIVRSGDVVTVRRGAQVRSLHPKRGTYVTQRAQTVKVHLVTSGFVLNDVEYPAEISWAGSGGYWCYVPLADVTLSAGKYLPKAPTIQTGS